MFVHCRYIAVHHPLNYSQTSNDGSALKRRMLKYLLPVSLLSLLFNVTKFFEATYDYGNERHSCLAIDAVALGSQSPPPQNSFFWAKPRIAKTCSVIRQSGQTSLGDNMVVFPPSAAATPPPTLSCTSEKKHIRYVLVPGCIGKQDAQWTVEIGRVGRGRERNVNFAVKGIRERK